MRRHLERKLLQDLSSLHKPSGYGSIRLKFKRLYCKSNGLPDEDLTAIEEIPIYSINKPKPESFEVLKILESTGEGKPKMMKGRLIEELEEVGIIDKNASIGAKHSKLNGLPNSISIAGSNNPLVEVEEIN